VSKSVFGSPVLIYVDDCCGHKIIDATCNDGTIFEGDGLLAGMNSLKEKRDGVSSQIKDEIVSRNKLREEIALLG